MNREQRLCEGLMGRDVIFTPVRPRGSDQAVSHLMAWVSVGFRFINVNRENNVISEI